MNKAITLLASLVLFVSCQEKINYDWGDINESLGELQKARTEVQSAMSEIGSEGYDISALQNVDNLLKKLRI